MVKLQGARTKPKKRKLNFYIQSTQGAVHRIGLDSVHSIGSDFPTGPGPEMSSRSVTDLLKRLCPVRYFTNDHPFPFVGRFRRSDFFFQPLVDILSFFPNLLARIHRIYRTHPSPATQTAMTPSVCAPSLLRSTNPHVTRLDGRNGQSRGARTSALASETTSGSRAPVVVNVPPPRISTSPPRPVPVVHSPAYLYQMGVTELKSTDEDMEESEVRESAFDSRPTGKAMSSGNPFERALASADNMLNNLEQNPDPATQAIWKATNSSAGQTAAKGVRGAAEFTVQAGAQAVKMAAPIGAWAVKQGVRVAMDMITQSSKRAKQSKNSKSDSDSN